MQKAGLLAALIGTVGLTIYAYPGADKRTGRLIPSHIEADHEVQTVSAIDKLKGSTRSEKQSVYVDIPLLSPQVIQPAPRVMSDVRQVLQAELAAQDRSASPVPPQPIVAKSLVPPLLLPLPLGGTARAATNEMDKLVARMPATVVVPIASTPASGTPPGATASATSPPKQASADSDPPAGETRAARTEREQAKPEHKRKMQRPATSHSARISQPSATPVARMATAPSVFRRNDGM